MKPYMIKEFEIYIKSHCEAPDFEIVIPATTKQEAVNILANYYDIDRQYVLTHCIQEL